MLVASAIMALAIQAQGPVLPPFCSPSFQAAVLSVEDALQKSDFTIAAARHSMLPKISVGIAWDDRKVPEAYRQPFRTARDHAIAMWQGKIRGLKFDLVAKGDLHISFEPVLAKRSG